MALSCRSCLARKQVCYGNEAINMNCSEQCLACNNCSRSVSIFISIYVWLSQQNCCIIYLLVSSLHWQLLCNRLRNKGGVLALLINKFRDRESTGRVQAVLLPCFLDFSAWPFSVLASASLAFIRKSRGLQAQEELCKLFYSYPLRLKISFSITMEPGLFTLSRSSVTRSLSLGKPRVSWSNVLIDDIWSYAHPYSNKQTLSKESTSDVVISLNISR